MCHSFDETSVFDNKSYYSNYGAWVDISAPGGESSRLKIYVDDLPQLSESETNSGPMLATNLPASVWGTLDPMGDIDKINFDANAGQTMVFDLNAKSLGSKANAVLTLSDSQGKVLASNNDFDGSDPFLAYTFAASGQYTIQVNELMLAGSKENFYRLSLGAIPFVVGCYPLSVPTNSESGVELIGYNLPTDHRVKVKTGQPGEIDVPIDPNHFRTRKKSKIIVGPGREIVEQEPNDAPAQANAITLPSVVNGRFWSTNQTPDADLYRFEAKPATTWVFETAAAQRGFKSGLSELSVTSSRRKISAAPNRRSKSVAFGLPLTAATR
jgi:hypothetical protein